MLGLNDQGQLGQGDIENRGDGPNEMGLNLLKVDLGTDGHLARRDVEAGPSSTITPPNAGEIMRPASSDWVIMLIAVTLRAKWALICPWLTSAPVPVTMR